MPQHDEVVFGTMEEHSSSPSTSHEGVRSPLRLGSVFSSVIKARKSSTSGVWDKHGSPTSFSTSELVRRMCRMFVSPAVVSSLLEGWVKYLSTKYPVVHTSWLREVHARSDGGLDIYEESVLHLVYANGGRVLEVVHALKPKISRSNGHIDGERWSLLYSSSLQSCVAQLGCCPRAWWFSLGGVPSFAFFVLPQGVGKSRCLDACGSCRSIVH